MDIADLIFGFVEKMPGWIWPVVLFGPLLAMLVFHLSLAMRRRSMWQRAAILLGYVHHDEDTNLAGTFDALASFADVDGFGTRSLDVLTNQAAGVQTWILDHATRKPRKFRTACVMRTNELQVPRFRLFRAGGSLRPTEEQVVFKDDPDFARLCVLTTDNPAAIERLFDATLRRHFLRMFHHAREIERLNTDWFSVLMLRLSNAIGRFEVEAAGDTLSVHLSCIINPRAAPELVALTAETLHILKGNLNAGGGRI
jgi:hypothetical protein